MSAVERKVVWAEAMHKCGYNTVEELADAMGFAPQTVHKWINGITNPRNRETVDMVCDLLYTDMDTLFPGWISFAERNTPEDKQSPLRKAMMRSQYDTITRLADAARTSYESVKSWLRGFKPTADHMVYRVAGLLNVDPTDIWPDWTPRDNALARAIYDAGYEHIAHFARDAKISDSTLDGWLHGECKPRTNEVAYRVADLLHKTPEELWPGWKPKTPTKAPTVKKEKPVHKTYSERNDHGITPLFSEPEITYNGMEHIRRKADVQVGKRLRVTYHYKDHTAHRIGTVVQRTDCFFRVQYDLGWCECFHYQARLDFSESKHFHDA